MSYKKVSRALMLLTVVCMIVGLYFTFGASAQGVTTVAVSPASQTVSPGQVFTVNVVVNPAVPIAGVQFDLRFNPSLVTANSVAEGNLLKQSGDPTFFLPGTIDNVAGTITGAAGAILGAGKTVSAPGTFATITFTAGTTAGTSPLDLSNVIVGDAAANPVPMVVTDGSVTITIPAGGGGGGGGGGAPAPTLPPTRTPRPTPTRTPRPTLTPTLTPTPAPTPTLTPTPAPTPTPTPNPAPLPKAPFNVWAAIAPVAGILLLAGLAYFVDLWRRANRRVG